MKQLATLNTNDNLPLAIIMARGGSKRIPKKNIRDFAGKPMITWPIKTALKSGLFSEVVVSTENEEISQIAQNYGAKVPFVRPQMLADDFATTAKVLQHALLTLSENTSSLPRHCCCIYGTSVFLTQDLLQSGYDKLQSENIDCVYTVTKYSHPVERSLFFDNDNLLQYNQPDFLNTRTQDIRATYYDIGLFYWVDIKAFLENSEQAFTSLRKSAVVVPHFSAVDIDTEEDWIFAEKLIKIRD